MIFTREYTQPGTTLRTCRICIQTKVQIDPREVYSMALQQNASSIVAIHKHPSGRLKPSPADKSITQQLMKGSEFINLRLLDHLIISEEVYFSFLDEGLFEVLKAEELMMFKNVVTAQSERHSCKSRRDLHCFIR